MTNAYKKGVSVSMTISPIAADMITKLVTTGLFGQTRAACCREFVYKALRELEARRFLEVVPAEHPGHGGRRQ